MSAYIQSWDDFIEGAVALYNEDPVHTRYCVKYRTKEGQLVLKVTDDRTCIKWRTDKREDLRKVEDINNVFFRLMTSNEGRRK